MVFVQCLLIIIKWGGVASGSAASLGCRVVPLLRVERSLVASCMAACMFCVVAQAGMLV